MGLKKSAKKKIWSCKHGCPNNVTACEHLNELIDGKKKSPTFEGTHRRVDKPIDTLYYTSGAGIVLPEGIKSGRYEAQFRAKCSRAGIPPLQIDILTHIYVYGDTFKETTEELGLTSIGTCIRLRNEAMKIVKRKGLK